MVEAVINNALRFAQQGLSVLPVRPGTKLPSREWKQFQDQIINETDIALIFEGQEIGVICGKVSGWVECLDFDDPKAFDEWEDLIEDHGGGEIYDKCYVQTTPSGGVHVVYRTVPDGVKGNLKLAMDSKNQVRIETRGEGGYFKCAPSEGYTPRNKNILSLPVLTEDEHELFISSARFLTHRITETVTGPIGPTKEGDSPGHSLNLNGNWFEILEPQGWTHAGKKGERDLWVRPGKKKSQGIGATTGNGPQDLLWVFTSNAMPLEHDRSYSKFGAYSYLYHGGNFQAAAKELVDKGYRKVEAGERTEPEKQKVAPSSGLTLTVFTQEDFQYVEPEYLIEPYLRRGKAVLLDADGGTGKTSFVAAMCAWFSNGFSLIGDYKIDGPIKILYLHKGEDENEEIESVYRANGGKAGFMAYSGADWSMTPQGCKQLEDTIKEHGFTMVVLDPMFAFLQNLPNADQLMKDQNAVYRVLAPLMDVYARTNTAAVHVRHTSKGTLGKAASELGMGSAGFRNRHRGQLVMRYHPDKENFAGVIGLTDEKGSLLTPKGQPFFFRRKGLEIERIDSIAKDPWEHREIIPQGKQGEVTQWLDSLLGEGVLYVQDVRQKAEAMGYHVPQVYKAKTLLGLIEESFAGRKTWKRAGYVDPYADN